MATVTVRHSKVSAVADSSDANLIQPSDWNDDHAATLAGLVATDISDSTATGRDVLTAANAAAARSTLSAAATGAVGSSGLTMATARLLGRSTASTGAIEEIVVGSNLTLSGGTLSGTGGGGASSLDGLDDVVLTAPADNDVLTYDSGTSKWINAAPTGGSGSSDFGRTPVVPVNADFTWFNQGSATVTDRSYAMCIDSPGESSNQIRGLVRTASLPSAPYRIRARIVGKWRPGSSRKAGLVLRNGTPNYIFFGSMPTQFVITTWSNPTTFNGIPLNLTASDTYDWLSIYDDATTRYYQVSPDGDTWATVYSETRTTYITATQAGIGVEPTSETAYNLAVAVYSFEIG